MKYAVLLSLAVGVVEVVVMTSFMGCLGPQSRKSLKLEKEALRVMEFFLSSASRPGEKFLWSTRYHK